MEILTVYKLLLPTIQTRLEEDEEGEEREALKWLKPHTQDPAENDRNGRAQRGGEREEGLVIPLRGEERERGETSSSSYEFSKDSIDG